MTKAHEEVLAESLVDSEVRQEYEALEAEFQVRRAIIELKRFFKRCGPRRAARGRER